MTLKELDRQYNAHNIHPSAHNANCSLCYAWEHRFDNPLADINGSGFGVDLLAEKE